MYNSPIFRIKNDGFLKYAIYPQKYDKDVQFLQFYTYLKPIFQLLKVKIKQNKQNEKHNDTILFFYFKKKY